MVPDGLRPCNLFQIVSIDLLKMKKNIRAQNSDVLDNCYSLTGFGIILSI
jgi:hypothetical protein